MKASPSSRLLWGPGRCSQSSLQEKSTASLRPGPSSCASVHRSHGDPSWLTANSARLSPALWTMAGGRSAPPSLRAQSHCFACFFVGVWLFSDTGAEHWDYGPGLHLRVWVTLKAGHRALCVLSKYSVTGLPPQPLLLLLRHQDGTRNTPGKHMATEFHSSPTLLPLEVQYGHATLLISFYTPSSPTAKLPRFSQRKGLGRAP